jgi:maleate isomerase
MAHESSLHSLTFEADAGLGTKARIGLIVLQTDQTIEHEFALLLRNDDVALYHARIPNKTEVTPETLKQMEVDLPVAAALLPARFDLDVIGYCCTSGATMIGEQRVDRILRQIHPSANNSNPLTACKAALSALGLKRIALVTPYVPSVTIPMRENLAEAGFQINAVASFHQSDDFVVARISPKSIAMAVEEIGSRDDCDGVFVSCTSLRTLPIIARAEARLGKPIISSNQALAWHLMRLTGLDECPNDCGQLLQKQLPGAVSR